MPKLFISYRRDESAYAAQTIYEKTVSHFGMDSVIFDIDSIPIGVDFRKYLNEQVSMCDVMLVIIGDKWLDISYKEGPNKGKRRLEDPGDFVRIEVEAALKRNIPVVPVLVGKASMPGEENLPPALVELAYRQASEVRAGTDFLNHINRLIKGLERLIKSIEAANKPSSQPSAAKKKTTAQPVLSPEATLALSVTPTRIEVGTRVTWKVTVGNTGNCDLYQVTLRRGNTLISSPFDLPEGKERRLTFTSIYSVKGEKTNKVIMTAMTRTGRGVSQEVSKRIIIEERKEPDPKKLKTKEPMRTGRGDSKVKATVPAKAGDIERALWVETCAVDTPEAYQNYLRDSQLLWFAEEAERFSGKKPVKKEHVARKERKTTKPSWQSMEFHTGVVKIRPYPGEKPEEFERRLWIEACTINTMQAYKDYLHKSQLRWFEAEAKKFANS